MGTLTDLIKPLDDLTDEELADRLYEIRKRKTVERPAAKKRAKKAAKKESKKTMSAAERALSELSPEELEELLKGLEQ